MPVANRILLVFIAAASLTVSSSFAQKVKVDYDQSVDFSRYKTYTVQHPATEPAHPLLYAHVVGTIEQELSAKGISVAEKDGDLILMLAGGAGYDLDSAPLPADCDNCKAPLTDPKDWPRNSAPPGVGGKPRPEGTVQVSFVDRATKKVVWTGMVTQKLDADKKSKAFDKAEKAIQKLLVDFPPKK